MSNSSHFFARDEDGAVTIWATSWTIVFLLIGGLSIDVGNAWKERSMLQSTADAAALAGAIELGSVLDEAARAEAIRIAELNLNNDVLVGADIISGKWDTASRTLDTAALVHDAVQVVTRRDSGGGNQVPTFLLKLIGITYWNVSTAATAQKFLPGCIKDGMVADNTVQISSNNNFFDGYCIHGQNGVQVSSNNFYEGPSGGIPGVIVSMNDLADFGMPASGFASSPGLQEALRENWMRPKSVDHIGEILTALLDVNSPRIPDFIDTTKPVIVKTRATFKPAAMLPGRIYSVNCSGSQQINFPANSLVRDSILVTSCRISTASGVRFESSIIATSNSASNSISSAQGAILGKDDNCAKGGGSLFLTAGGVDYAAHLEVYGSQVIAAGDIKIVAESQGIEGASFQSGNDIKLTSNGSFGNCNSNVDEIVYEDYFRLVN